MQRKNVTKRIKKKRDKTKLWNLFDNEINKKNPTLEQLYSLNEMGNKDKCDLCNSSLFYSEERFLTCSNKKCGIIYKDTLDETAEWRYYGANDNKSVNPTRCGMPINPLLKESSYGCKVVCSGKTASTH